MKAQFVFFGFDLFGSSGTVDGVDLLANEVQEILDDNEDEVVATRADRYTEHVEITHVTFETLESYENWQATGKAIVQEALRNGDFLVWVTGNHLGALPVYEAIAEQEESLVVQLDAHLDIHNFADCVSTAAHGNFLLHCQSLPPIVNIGHRDQLLPKEYIGEYFERTWPIEDVVTGSKAMMKSLAARCESAKRIFLDIDSDCFDPTFFPAVKQPVPFGLTPQQVLSILEGLNSEKVQGLILSEFAPDLDIQDRCLATLVWLIEHILLRKFDA